MGQYHEAMEYISKCQGKLAKERAKEEKKEERAATAAESS
jgi:hypothetical protein